jgi:hypothetical protein
MISGDTSMDTSGIEGDDEDGHPHNVDTTKNIPHIYL